MKMKTLVFSLSLLFSPLLNAEVNKSSALSSGIYESQSLEELQDVALQKRSTGTSEEQSLRIDLIYDEAVELGISNGYAQTMDLFIEVIESKAALFDMLLPFESLSNIAGDLNATEARFIRPGIVDKTTNSAAVKSRVNLTMIELKNQSYYLREQPQPVLRPPSWTDYIYDSNKIKVHSISKELLPRTEEEKEAYLDGLNEGWAMGIDQARVEMKTRFVDAYRDAIGMVRYINAVESNLLEKPSVVVDNIGTNINGDELSMGIKKVYLDSRAQWTKNSNSYNSPQLDTRESVRQTIRSLIALGVMTEQDIRDAHVMKGQQ